MNGPIFINYRRNISAHAAGRLADQLARHLEGRRLFLDVDGIEPGLDFVKVLSDQVAQCEAFIAVIGPGWAEAKNSAGTRCLDSPNDYVRIEIEAALKRDIRLIPVLVDGARMPAADDLPEPLKPLSRRNAVEITHHRFGPEVEALAGTLQRALGAEPQSNAAQIPAAGRASAQEVAWSELLFSFRGRISRKTFWLGFVGILTASALMFVTLRGLLGESASEVKNDVSRPSALFNEIYWVSVIPLYWPIFALLVKRLHDFGQGWGFVWPFAILSVLYKLSLLAGPEDVTVFLGAVFLTIYGMIGCIRGTCGSNQYGPDPLSRPRA
jgi:uncharacterized membrane protein YhaH (DUF805 family)